MSTFGHMQLAHNPTLYVHQQFHIYEEVGSMFLDHQKKYLFQNLMEHIDCKQIQPSNLLLPLQNVLHQFLQYLPNAPYLTLWTIDGIDCTTHLIWYLLHPHESHAPHYIVSAETSAW